MRLDMNKMILLKYFIYSVLLTFFIMVIFQPKPKEPVLIEVELTDVYHLACRFNAESYEPSVYINNIKYPMTCGCSELKGTCHQ